MSIMTRTSICKDGMQKIYDFASTLTQLASEQDFATGGDDNLFGETTESCLEAVKKILERIENPLAETTQKTAIFREDEREFYSVLVSKISLNDE